MKDLANVGVLRLRRPTAGRRCSGWHVTFFGVSPIRDRSDL